MSIEQIKPSEFRIGNFVKTDLKDSDFDNNIYQIETIANEFPTLNTIEFGIGVIDWNNINPIPLTEDWHIKFGGEKTNRHWFTYEFENVEISHNIENGVVNLFLNKNSKEPIIIRDISKVHTFQNLIFALTNEELKITE